MKVASNKRHVVVLGLTLGLLSSMGVSRGVSRGVNPLGPAPAMAQAASPSRISPQQVSALAQALRLSADQGPGLGSEPYYSAWQVKGSSIPAWSKGCLGHSLTPQQFADSPDVARSVVLCVLDGNFRNEIAATGGNEAIAVQRVAAWWRTGDAARYRDGSVSSYAQTVAGLYQQQLAEQRKSNQPVSPDTTTFTGSTAYDRYMSAGYQFTRDNDPGQAMVYFQRALDEKPGDSFATSALRDLDRSLSHSATAPTNRDTPTQDSVPELTSQYWVEVAANGAGDRILVAPSSITVTDGTQTRLAYWEYRAFRGDNAAFLPRLALDAVEGDPPVRSALLYRAVNCPAANTLVRVMKVYTNQRQEIFQQDFGSAGLVETPSEGSSTAASIAYACGQIGGSPEPEASPLEQPAIEGAADSIR